LSAPPTFISIHGIEIFSFAKTELLATAGSLRVCIQSAARSSTRAAQAERAATQIDDRGLRRRILDHERVCNGDTF
jgi:hypothetical protein